MPLISEIQACARRQRLILEPPNKIRLALGRFFCAALPGLFEPLANSILGELDPGPEQGAATDGTA